jgi:hypothetical protein
MCHCENSDVAMSESRCICRAAAVRAYGSMLGAGEPEKYALEAACRVYRFHHPEDALEVARLSVERWVHAGRAH